MGSFAGPVVFTPLKSVFLRTQYIKAQSEMPCLKGRQGPVGTGPDWPASNPWGGLRHISWDPRASGKPWPQGLYYGQFTQDLRGDAPFPSRQSMSWADGRPALRSCPAPRLLAQAQRAASACRSALALLHLMRTNKCAHRVEFTCEWWGHPAPA